MSTDSEMSAPATPEQKKAMSTAIKSVCLYTISDLLYKNSFMLMYLAALEIPGDMILVYLSIPSLIYMLGMIPAAHYSGRWTYVGNGVAGLSITAFGLLLLLAAPMLKPFGKEWILILAGMATHGAGGALYTSNWFPLTSLFVPDKERGHFFGNMRFYYQMVSIVFGLIVILALKQASGVKIFQIFIGAAMLLKVGGIIIYAKLPTNPVVVKTGVTLRESFLRAVSTPGYMPFCAYTFLLMLATGCCANLFGLLARGPMGFSGDEVILTGNMLMVGAVVGFFVGGKMVDRFGTKAVFMVCHFSFGIVLLTFLARGFLASGMELFFICSLSMVFGAVQAASGIALTSEMLSLTPKDNKPVATALNQSLMNMGIALSGLFSSQAIKFGLLNDSWLFGGHKMSQYDTLILFCAVMVVILVVTLGLVPSVVKRAQSAYE